MIAATRASVSRSRRSTRTSGRTRAALVVGDRLAAGRPCPRASASASPSWHRPLAAGLRRFFPPRDPRRERLRLGGPSGSPSSAALSPRLRLGSRSVGTARRLLLGRLRARSAGGTWIFGAARLVAVARCLGRPRRRSAAAPAAGFLRPRPPRVPRRVRFFFGCRRLRGDTASPSPARRASTSSARLGCPRRPRCPRPRPRLPSSTRSRRRICDRDVLLGSRRAHRLLGLGLERDRRRGRRPSRRRASRTPRPRARGRRSPSPSCRRASRHPRRRPRSRRRACPTPAVGS